MLWSQNGIMFHQISFYDCATQTDKHTHAHTHTHTHTHTQPGFCVWWMWQINSPLISFIQSSISRAPEAADAVIWIDQTTGSSIYFVSIYSHSWGAFCVCTCVCVCVCLREEQLTTAIHKAALNSLKDPQALNIHRQVHEEAVGSSRMLSWDPVQLTMSESDMMDAVLCDWLHTHWGANQVVY